MRAGDNRSMTRQQHHVEQLLAQIRDGVVDLQRMRVRGVRGRPLAEREREVAAVRERLAHAVSGR
jgi:hypothetical protein